MFVFGDWYLHQGLGIPLQVEHRRNGANEKCLSPTLCPSGLKLFEQRGKGVIEAIKKVPYFWADLLLAIPTFRHLPHVPDLGGTGAGPLSREAVSICSTGVRSPRTLR